MTTTIEPMVMVATGTPPCRRQDHWRYVHAATSAVVGFVSIPVTNGSAVRPQGPGGRSG